MVEVRGLPSTCMLAFLLLLTTHDSNRRLVEGEWLDSGIPDPLSDMFALLTARRNRALTQQWGVWLAGKDAERALKVRHHALLFSGAFTIFLMSFHSY